MGRAAFGVAERPSRLDHPFAERFQQMQVLSARGMHEIATSRQFDLLQFQRGAPAPDLVGAISAR
jgi:hypothetical protein